MTNTPLPPGTAAEARSGERGAALVLALMVSLVLVFLGLGLLLQTSLGLQASGTDRWVTKALYAADAGAMMQIGMIQRGVLGAPSSFVLVDDPDLPGLLKTQFTVTITDFCSTEPDRPLEGYEAGDEAGYSQRFFHFRSESTRSVGDLAGLTRAAVEADIAAQPFNNAEFVPVIQCY
jgi:Tfp pilus assembly protein PilX